MLSSADDRTIKLWDADGMQERLLLEKQPDWAPALAFVTDRTVIVGRLDGSLGEYDVATGKLITSLQRSERDPNETGEKVKLAGASSGPETEDK